MKATIFVRRLNKTGIFVSSLDQDKIFADEYNPKGFFKFYIEPIENEIRYAKVKGGYVVHGEGYIFTGYNEKTIDKDIIELKKKRQFPNHFFTEDKSLIEWFNNLDSSSRENLSR